MEEWKDIQGFEGLYQVSNLGRIKSLPRIDQLGRINKGRILKPGENTNGYLQVYLSKNGIQRHFIVHRLVMENFNPRDDMYLKTDEGAYVLQVDHINNIKTDNRLENLQWLLGRKNHHKEIDRRRFKRELLKIMNEV